MVNLDELEYKELSAFRDLCSDTPRLAALLLLGCDDEQAIKDIYTLEMASLFLIDARFAGPWVREFGQQQLDIFYNQLPDALKWRS